MKRFAVPVALLLIALSACAHTPPDVRLLATSHDELGAQMMREGDFVGAMRELLTAADLDPRSATIQMHLAVAYRNRGLPEEGLKALQRAADLEPEDPEVRQALGMLLLDLHRYDEAIPELQAAAKNLRYATPHFAYTSLGNAWLGKGNAQRAIESFGLALETAPNYVFAHRGRADAYYLLGRYEDAAEGYRTALSFHASDGDSLLGLGLCQARLGRLKEARESFEQATNVAPGSEAARRAGLYIDRLDRGLALEPGP